MMGNQAAGSCEATTITLLGVVDGRTKKRVAASAMWFAPTRSGAMRQRETTAFLWIGRRELAFGLGLLFGPASFLGEADSPASCGRQAAPLRRSGGGLGSVASTTKNELDGEVVAAEGITQVRERHREGLHLFEQFLKPCVGSASGERKDVR